MDSVIVSCTDNSICGVNMKVIRDLSPEVRGAYCKAVALKAPTVVNVSIFIEDTGPSAAAVEIVMGWSENRPRAGSRSPNDSGSTTAVLTSRGR